MAKKKKYTYATFSAHENYLDQRVTKYMDEGWEFVGNFSCHYHGSPTSAVFHYCTMRKPI